MRIQNGSNNILLDNIESETSPIVYTRRSRFLDDELNETKDIITSPGRGDSPMAISSTNVSMVMLHGQPSLIDQSVKSDLENAVASLNIPKNNDLFISNSNENNLIDHIGVGRHHNCLDKVENENENVNKTCNQSSELDMEESALLRRQQLTRVAEWVQNNQLENIEPISSLSSMDATSVDSGYKTKVNNNNCNETKIIGMTADNHDCLHHTDNGNIVGDTSLSDNIKTESNFAQTNNIQINNNLIHLNQYVTVNGIDMPSSDATISQPNSGCSHQNQNAQIDLAQMEYNVKQFLLKQNEWSNNKNNSGIDERCDGNAGNSIDLTSNLSLTNKNPHRTETNL